MSQQYNEIFFKELQKKTRQQCKAIFDSSDDGDNEKEIVTLLLKEYCDGYKDFADIQKRYKQVICRIAAGKATKEDKEEIKTGLDQHVLEDHQRLHVFLEQMEPILLEKLNDNSHIKRLQVTALLQCTMVTQERPKRLAKYCQEQEKSELVFELIDSVDTIKAFMINGGPSGGNFVKAYELYKRLLPIIDTSQSSVIKDCHRRLALAVALEHATPIEFRLDKGNCVDPIARFQHYQEAHLNGELDPAFGYFSTWELRLVVDSGAHDEELTWGRRYLRNYRPDQAHVPNLANRYSRTCASDLTYNVPKDKTSYQGILSGGGMCVPYAWFGRFINKAFGIPTWGCQQPNHAAYSKWMGNSCESHGDGKSGWTLQQANTGCDWLQSYCYSGKQTSGQLFQIEADGRSFVDHCQNSENHVFNQLTIYQCMAIITGEDMDKARKTVCSPLNPNNYWTSLAHTQLFLWSSKSKPRHYERGPVHGKLDKKFLSIQNCHQQINARKVKPKDASGIGMLDDGSVIIPSISYLKPRSKAIQHMKSYHDGGWQVYLKNRQSQVVYKVQSPFISKESVYFNVSCKLCTVHTQHEEEKEMLCFETKGVKNESAQDEGIQEENHQRVIVPYTMGEWQYTTPKVKLRLKKGDLLKITRMGEKCNKGLSLKHVLLEPC